METIILFAPLVGALICGFLAADRRTGGLRRRHRASVPVRVAELGRLPGFDGRPADRTLFTWIESGTLFTDWAIRLDRLTAIMLIVITTVSALVHLYSFGYMAHDDNFARARATGRASSPICRSSPSRC
jgi:NADH-quinone oxidoreductase subunit L